MLYEAGDLAGSFFIVTAGQIEIVRPSAAGDTLITALGPGQFTGEANMLSGRLTRHCSSTLRIREFLTRNGHPYAYIDLDSDSDTQEMLDHFTSP